MTTEPPTMETELVLASDGAIYIRFEEEPPADRQMFTGYALTADERARYGTQGLLRWACLQLLALGSDGCVYVEEGAIDAEGARSSVVTPSPTRKPRASLRSSTAWRST